jgi:hypothetical protein
MRVISKFHDYYDKVQMHGQDPNLVYVRNKKVIYPEKRLFCKEAKGPEALYRPLYLYERRRGINQEKTVNLFIIGFCGRLYPTLSFDQYSWNRCFQGPFLYNIAEVDKYVENHWDEVRQEKYRGERPQYERRYYPALFTRKEMAKWFEEYTVADDTLFIEYECPVFYYQLKYSRYDNKLKKKVRPGDELVLHPCLKQMEFFKVFDAQLAFQELSMYLSGVLGLTSQKGKPIYQGQKMDDTVSDQDMIEAKGFDKKWSFRKEPKK